MIDLKRFTLGVSKRLVVGPVFLAYRLTPNAVKSFVESGLHSLADQLGHLANRLIGPEVNPSENGEEIAPSPSGNGDSGGVPDAEADPLPRPDEKPKGWAAYADRAREWTGRGARKAAKWLRNRLTVKGWKRVGLGEYELNDNVFIYEFEGCDYWVYLPFRTPRQDAWMWAFAFLLTLGFPLFWWLGYDWYLEKQLWYYPSARILAVLTFPLIVATCLYPALRVMWKLKYPEYDLLRLIIRIEQGYVHYRVRGRGEWKSEPLPRNLGLGAVTFTKIDHPDALAAAQARMQSGRRSPDAIEKASAIAISSGFGGFGRLAVVPIMEIARDPKWTLASQANSALDFALAEAFNAFRHRDPEAMPPAKGPRVPLHQRPLRLDAIFAGLFLLNLWAWTWVAAPASPVKLPTPRRHTPVARTSAAQAMMAAAIKNYLRPRFEVPVEEWQIDHLAAGMSETIANSGLPAEVVESWYEGDGSGRAMGLYKIKDQARAGTWNRSIPRDIFDNLNRLVHALERIDPLLTSTVSSLFEKDIRPSGWRFPEGLAERLKREDRYRGNGALQRETVDRLGRILTYELSGEGLDGATQDAWRKMVPERYLQADVLLGEHANEKDQFYTSQRISYWWYKTKPEGIDEVVENLPFRHPLRRIGPPRAAAPAIYGIE